MLSKSMIKKTGIVFTGNVLSQLFALIFMIIVTRILSKEDYGFVSYIISMGSFFATIVAGGFPVAITRYIAKDPEREKSYIENGLFGSVLLFLIISIIELALFWPHFEVVVITFVSMIVMLYLGILRGEKEFKLYALVNAGRNAIKLAILIILIISSFVTKESVIWTYALAGITIVFLVEFAYYRKSFILPKYDPKIFKTILKFSLPLLVTTVFYSLTSNSGIAILEKYLGYSAVASYKNALLLLTIYGFVPGAIGTILLPNISSTKSPDKIIRNLKNSILFSLLIELIIFILALIFGKPLIILFLGKKYADVFPIFIVMSFGAFASSIRNIFASLWEGTGRPWIAMIDMIIAGSSITILTLAFIPYGINGAAYAYSIGFTLAAITDIAFFIYYKYRSDIFTTEKIHV